AAPQWLQRPERKLRVGIRTHGADGRREGLGEARRLRRDVRLHLHLEHFKRAQSNIGKDFSASTGSCPQGHLLASGLDVLLTDKAGVEILEHFIEAELEASLRTISEESGQP